MRCEYDVKIMMAHLITLGNDTKLYAYRDCKAAFLCHMSAFEQGDTKERRHHHRIQQGNEQTRTFEPTNESADCWSAMHSYNFNFRVKSCENEKSQSRSGIDPSVEKKGFWE